jgi:hypothetical protein
MSGVSNPYAYFYETIAASQTAQPLGTTGAKGDYLHRLIVTVTATATSTVTLIDNATSIVIVAATTPVGIYSIEFNAASVSGAWKVTTGAGATVIAVGNFTP